MEIGSLRPSNILRKNENCFHNSEMNKKEISFGTNIKTIRVDLDSIPKELRPYLNEIIPSPLGRLCQKVSGIFHKAIAKIFGQDLAQREGLKINMLNLKSNQKIMVIINKLIEKDKLCTVKGYMQSNTDCYHNFLTNIREMEKYYENSYKGSELTFEISEVPDYIDSYNSYINLRNNSRTYPINVAGKTKGSSLENDENIFRTFYPNAEKYFEEDYVPTEEELNQLKEEFRNFDETQGLPKERKKFVQKKIAGWEKCM